MKQCETLLAPYSAKRLVTKVTSHQQFLRLQPEKVVTGSFSASFFQRFFWCFQRHLCSRLLSERPGADSTRVFLASFRPGPSCATYQHDNSSTVTAPAARKLRRIQFSSTQLQPGQQLQLQQQQRKLTSTQLLRSQFYNVHYGHSGYWLWVAVFSDRHLNCS